MGSTTAGNDKPSRTVFPNVKPMALRTSLLGPARPSRRRAVGSAATVVAFAVLLTPYASGQDNPDDAITTISVDVRVVNVLATVRDKKGQLVSDLTRDDFIIEEDGKPQEIRYFARQADLPLTIGLLVDTSVSQERVLGPQKQASRSVLRRSLAA